MPQLLEVEPRLELGPPDAQAELSSLLHSQPFSLPTPQISHEEKQELHSFLGSHSWNSDSHLATGVQSGANATRKGRGQTYLVSSKFSLDLSPMGPPEQKSYYKVPLLPPGS